MSAIRVKAERVARPGIDVRTPNLLARSWSLSIMASILSSMASRWRAIWARRSRDWRFSNGLCSDFSRFLAAVMGSVAHVGQTGNRVIGTVPNIVLVARFHYQTTNLSRKMTANWVFASNHSRGGP